MTFRILVVPYPRTWLIEGGHRTQQFETARALRALGCSVAIGDISLAKRRGFDVVHFFGDPKPLLAQGRPPCPLVVSPVYFPARLSQETFRWSSNWGRRALYPATRHLWEFRHRSTRPHRQKELHDQIQALQECDMIVVNSDAEDHILRADSNGGLPPTRVAYSGVDSSFFEGHAELGWDLVGLPRNSPFVLCVGRFEPRKNQLSLVRAMRNVPHPLVLIGQVLPGNQRYAAKCKEIAHDLIHVERLDHSQLPHVYRAASLHVLPSWYETTGLATLEAMAAGLPVIASQIDCVEDYFGGCATIVDPGSVSALRRAIKDRFGRPRGCERDHAMRFRWTATARKLLEIYSEVSGKG